MAVNRAEPLSACDCLHDGSDTSPVGGRDWAEADAGLAEEPFGLADAAGHGAVGVSQPGALGVLSGEQHAPPGRLAQCVGVGWAGPGGMRV